jgi:uncharacterized Tic20 family protein
MTGTDSERHWAAIACLSTIFLGPFGPLIVWMAEGRRSRFVRWYLVQALNLTLTFLIYAVCVLIATGLLTLASTALALALMAIVFALGWAFLVVHMIRCAGSASNGEFRELPHWACATIVRQPAP